MKTLKNYNDLVKLVETGKQLAYEDVDLEFDLFEHAECEREVNGYAVKDFENGISIIEAGASHFCLTSMIFETIKAIDEFHGNN